MHRHSLRNDKGNMHANLNIKVTIMWIESVC